MKANSNSEVLKGLRRQLHLMQLQLGEYESGRTHRGVENGISAAHKCAEMVATYRSRIDNLNILVSAYEQEEDAIALGPMAVFG
jgi:hypothetical protein